LINFIKKGGIALAQAKKKKIMIGFVLLLIAFVTPTVDSYGAVNWKGVIWDGTYGANLSVVGETLMVSPLYASSSSSGATFGAAHHVAADISATTGSSGAAISHWVEITFIDDPMSTIQIWLKQIYEVYTEIGERDDSNNYMILIYDYRRSQLSLIDTGVPRKQNSSSTTVKVKWQENKGIEYFIDGALVYNDEGIKLNYFGEIFLAAKDDVGTFVDYQTGSEESLSPLIIDIDIKPGGNPDSINLKSKGVVPVAIITTDSIDALEVDPSTTTFANAKAVRWSAEDVDGDGREDMVFHFNTQDLELDEDSSEATLSAFTCEGISIEGSGRIRIVPKRK